MIKISQKTLQSHDYETNIQQITRNGNLVIYNEYPLKIENSTANILSNEIIWDGGNDWGEQFYIVLGNNSSTHSRKIIFENNLFEKG